MQEQTQQTNSATSIWVIGILCALLVGGGIYLVMSLGGGRKAFEEAEQSSRTPMELGRKLYVTAGCAACHRPDGRGEAGRYPPLAGSEWVRGNPARLKRVLLHGMNGRVTIGGMTYNSEMPPAGQYLSDKHIAAILTYIRAEWGNNAPAVAPESVAATRALVQGRRRPWTADELLPLEKDDYTPAPTTQGGTALAQ